MAELCGLSLDRHRLNYDVAGNPITDLEFGARYALTKPTRHGRVWARLHKLRVQNPVLVFGDRARWLYGLLYRLAWL